MIRINKLLIAGLVAVAAIVVIFAMTSLEQFAGSPPDEFSGFSEAALMRAIERLGMTPLLFRETVMARIERDVEEYIEAHGPTKICALCIVDDESPLELLGDRPDVLVCRVSLDPRRVASNERLLPYVFDIPPRPLNSLPPASKPRVSFCGYVGSHPGRPVALDILENDPRLASWFIRRDAFWAGALNDPVVIRDYYDNMRASEFNLCVRGTGNFCMRFYETLAAGRIPVVLADMPLPYVPGVSWEDVCVIAPSTESLGDAIVDFWRTRDVQETQRKCAEVYAAHFTTDAVARRLLSGDRSY